MNLDSNAVGLSARQKINFHFNNYFWALIILLVLLLASAVSTRGQVMEPSPKNGKEPKVDIKINRYYDNKGNVIGYDSSYTSYYSNVYGDTLGTRTMKNFDRYFGSGRTPFFDKLLGTGLFNDSILAPNFLYKDFPSHDFLPDQSAWRKFFDDMTHRLDSLKNGFFHEDIRRRYRL